MNNIGPNILVNLSILCQLISKNLFLYMKLAFIDGKIFLPTTIFNFMQKLQKLFDNESFNR